MGGLPDLLRDCADKAISNAGDHPRHPGADLRTLRLYLGLDSRHGIESSQHHDDLVAADYSVNRGQLSKWRLLLSILNTNGALVFSQHA